MLKCDHSAIMPPKRPVNNNNNFTHWADKSVSKIGFCGVLVLKEEANFDNLIGIFIILKNVWFQPEQFDKYYVGP